MNDDLIGARYGTYRVVCQDKEFPSLVTVEHVTTGRRGSAIAQFVRMEIEDGNGEYATQH